MSSLTRMLSVLDLFSRDHTTMTAEQIAEALSLTRTTCYRYTRELAQAGLLVSHGGHFMLGPRIIELDHRMIESDPLINAGGPAIRALADAVGATGLLTAGYADHVVNVFAHTSGGKPLPLSFGRGTTMPMFRSSTSKVLLAALSRGRLRRVWERHAEEPDCQAIGADWKAFWRTLQGIQASGYATSFGEVDPGLAGLSAPVRYADGEIAGAMSLIFRREDFERFDLQLLATRLCMAAADVSLALQPVHAQPVPQVAATPVRKAAAKTAVKPAVKAAVKAARAVKPAPKQASKQAPEQAPKKAPTKAPARRVTAR